MTSKLTVLIPCKDERAHIEECVLSVLAVADEVLVADSGSTDGTLEILNRLQCRVIEREYINSASFKNWAIPQATHEWVLVVDADERVTPELAEEIRGILGVSPAHDAYSLRRDFTFLGRPLSDCGMTSNRLVRLFRRDQGRYSTRRVHADVEISKGAVGHLCCPLRHHMVIDLDHFLSRQLRYSAWAALDSWERGNRVSFARMLLHTPLRFLQLYLLRRGFLNGRSGLVFCGILAFYTFLKDVKLWALETGAASHDKMEAAARSDSLTHLLDEPEAESSPVATLPMTRDSCSEQAAILA